MEILAEEISKVFYDYHAYLGYNFTAKHVLKWVNQFERKDQKFLLEEFLHLTRQGIYITEVKAKELLIARVVELSEHFKFKHPVEFLKNVEFLRLQPELKSQCFLLKLIKREIKKVFGIEFDHCGTVSTKYAIYLDDVLATGGTVYNDCLRWLNIKNSDGVTNLDKVVKKEKVLCVSLFCIHSWANVDWRLKMVLGDDILRKIIYSWEYEIQNHPKTQDQKLNFAYPNNEQPQSVLDYLNGLTAQYNGEYAFRKSNRPANEEFFSSAENRVRFENIILMKGIELLNQAVHLKPNHRPMGATTPSKKTLGTGTLFFTWRNISNTSPIVFWWAAANWYPLFPLSNRGGN